MEEVVLDHNPAEKELRSTVASTILWTPSSLPKKPPIGRKEDTS